MDPKLMFLLPEAKKPNVEDVHVGVGPSFPNENSLEKEICDA